MKKSLTLLLAATMIISMATIASAASTTTLTTTVPAATYTLNIPADQEINYGTTETDIGFVTVTNSSGFAKGKNLQVTVTYTPFSNNELSTNIPYTLVIKNTNYDTPSKTLNSGDSVIFRGETSGIVESEPYLGDRMGTSGNTSYGYAVNADSCILKIKSEDWGKALGGEYYATITFTAEVVVE